MSDKHCQASYNCGKLGRNFWESGEPGRKWKGLTYNFSANILLRRGGIWKFSLVFESQIPNPTSPEKDVCYLHHDLNQTKHRWLKLRVLFKTPRFWLLCFLVELGLNSGIFNHLCGLRVVLCKEYAFFSIQAFSIYPKGLRAGSGEAFLARRPFLFFCKNSRYS